MSIGENPFDDLDWEGRRCIVKDLSAKTGREVIRRVFNLVGPALENAARLGLEANVEVAGAAALGGVLGKIDAGTVEWLTSTFLAVTLVEREPGTEDWIDAKKVEELMFGGGVGQRRYKRWMTFCLQTSCGDFFSDVFAQFRSRVKTSTTGSKTGAPFDPVTGANGTASPSPSTSPNPGGFTA